MGLEPVASLDLAQGIGRRLKAWRAASSLTVDQIAERLGTCRASLYRFEDGNIPKLQAAEAIAALLGRSLSQLLAEVEASAKREFSRS